VPQEVIGQYLTDLCPTRESMSIEKATISNLQQVVAIVEVLERFGEINETGKQIAPNTTH